MTDMKSEGINVCCTSGTPQAGGDYACKGSLIELAPGLQAYHVGSGPKAVIMVYDIFGFDITNTRHFADMLVDGAGASKLQIVMPDIYRGNPWPMDKFPIKDPNEIKDWLDKVGTWDIVHKDLQTARAFLTSKGATGKMGIIGFCWGGKQSIQACSMKEFGAGVAVHGAWLGPEDAEKVSCPMLFMPAGDDPPIAPIEDVLKNKPFGSQCAYKTFGDMQHGFAAGRGDWSDPKTLACVNEANKMAQNFFLNHL